jgi:hypothetical protein
MNQKILTKDVPMKTLKKSVSKRKPKIDLSPLESRMLGWLSTVQTECDRLVKSDAQGGFDHSAFTAWKVRSKLCLAELLGKDHAYYSGFCVCIEDDFAASAYICEQGSHLLKAIRDDLESGYLRGYRGLIQAELFTDFLDMADHLFGEGYKDAATVIAGSVLEDHIKRLCQKNGIALTLIKPNGTERPLTASELAEALGKAKIFELPMQQSVKGWQALRNNAAHGKYETYEAGEVKLLLLGVRQFMQTVAL